MDEPEREHHEVHGQDGAAGLEPRRQHPAGSAGCTAAGPSGASGGARGDACRSSPARRPARAAPARPPGPTDLQVTPAMKRKMAPMSHLFQLSSTYSMTFFTRCVSSSVKKPWRGAHGPVTETHGPGTAARGSVLRGRPATHLPDLLQHQREHPEVERDLGPRRPLRGRPEVHQQHVGEEEEEGEVHEHVAQEHGHGRAPELPPAREQEGRVRAPAAPSPRRHGPRLCPAPQRRPRGR